MSGDVIYLKESQRIVEKIKSAKELQEMVFALVHSPDFVCKNALSELKEKINGKNSRIEKSALLHNRVKGTLCTKLLLLNSYKMLLFPTYSRS